MACRNEAKANTAKANILTEVPRADLKVMVLDLNSLDSVRKFAKNFEEKFTHLDLLINNAGIMVPPFSQTKDGFESQMGVNYFSHFLLTGLLLPILNKTEGARVISLSSKAHEQGKIDFENLNSEKDYSRLGAYSQSKLACLMYAYELDRRLKQAGSSVISIAAHPGASNTELARHLPRWLYYLLYPIVTLISHSPKNGTLPQLQAAIDLNVAGGDYFGPTGFNGMKGKPGKVESKPHSHDKDVARKLWKVSEELTGINYL
ncbi:UNVERIFIED_CONTAM: hypothetical protein GTU68_042779 [Idotea baltica]|nr:hypothetical protein [Idotea baltica]